MGVMTCNKENCENIMCDRRSHLHGYICYSCFEQLISTGPATDISEFMKSPPTHSSQSEAAEARYNVEFP